jgi:hypothetical protein
VLRSKNVWSYISTLQYVFMAWCLVKYRDNFTFTFTSTGTGGEERFLVKYTFKLSVSLNMNIIE